MTRLPDIPVHVALPGPNVSAGIGGIAPLLREIDSLLEALALRGESGSVDLRGLPLAPGEYDSLREILGAGEVRATVEAYGTSEVYETAVSGVWWVTHRGPDGETVAELIEVTQAPEILKTDPADVRAAHARFRAVLDPSGGRG